MKYKFKSMLAAAAAVLAATGGAVLIGGAAPASAATSTNCTSTLVKTVTLKAATGNVLGEGRLYSNGKGGWCAMTVHTGSFVGKTTYTSVWIGGMKQSGSAETGYGDADMGNFSHYAGPALVAGPCVKVVFGMDNASQSHGNTTDVVYGCNANNHVKPTIW